MTIVHTGLANACLIFSLIIAGYGFWCFFRNQGLSGAFRGVLLFGELLYLAQMIVGITMAVQGLSPVSGRGWVHYLYGVVIVISIPGVFAITKGRDDRSAALTYAVLGLFLAGVALRAMSTAS
jgi:hypothetical protein